MTRSLVLGIRAALVVLSVFAVGVLAGMVYVHHGPSPQSPRSQPLARLSIVESEAAMADLRTELALEDEQVEQIHAILAEHQETVQKLWEELRPEVQEAVRRVHVDISELLRPDQRQGFHDWLMRHHAGDGHPVGLQQQ